MNSLAIGAATAPALIEASTGRGLTYRDLERQASRIASAVGPARSLVFIRAGNDLFSVLAYLGCLEAGHVVALVDARLPGPRLQDLVERYRPAVVLGPPGTDEALPGQPASRSLADGEFVELGRGAPELDAALSLLLSTSGTTGSSKFARLSRANVLSNASAIAMALGLTSLDRPITSLPLHYTFGLSIINSHLQVGASVVLTDTSVVQAPFWDVFREFGCTTLAGVPFTFRLLERIGFREMDLPTLSTIQQAGGALDRETTALYAQHMAARGGRFFVMYGQTEATARISILPPARLSDKLGSAGIALPGGSLEIAGPADGIHGRPVIGEVVYRGPNVMLGYAESAEDLRAGDELHGVLHTGDIGYLDDEEYLFLVGRSKRIAKLFGHRINLDEVERHLASECAAAAVGTDDALWVFCETERAQSLDRLQAGLAEYLRVNRNLVHVRQVDALPLSSSGKIDYNRVHEWIPASDDS